MFGLLKFSRSARPNRFRSFKLGLEELCPRATPSGIDQPPASADPTPSYVAPPEPAPPPAQTAPVIDNFDAIEVGHGFYKITGHVTSANVNGMVVTFAGIPAINGKTAVCDADGNFTLVIPVKTDGSDRGGISAQTTNANGQQSNLALAFVTPTP